MKTIIKKFEEVGLKVELSNKLINLEQQDAKALLKKFNLKTRDNIKVKTKYIKDIDSNVLVFSTDESEEVVFSGIDYILSWYDAKSLLYKNWENSKARINESNPFVAQFRPTLVLDSIKKKLIENKVVKGGILKPLVDNRKEMVLDSKFTIIYVYLSHTEMIEVRYLKQKDIIKLFLDDENFDEVYAEIKHFIESKTRFRKVLLSKLKLGFLKNLKLKNYNK